VAQPETEVLATESAPGLDPESRQVLHEYYLHMGSLLVDPASRPGEDEWMVKLARAGFVDIADAHENMELISGNPHARCRGMMELFGRVGQRLRAIEEPEPFEGVHAQDRSDLADSPNEVAETDEPFEEAELKRRIRLMRVGSLEQKREAALFVAQFLLKQRRLAREDLGQMALEAMAGNWESSITVEVTECLAALSVPEAKRAKAALDQKRELFSKLEKRIRSFWDGALLIDPIDDLDDIEAVTMGIWMRRSTDHVAGHVAETIVNKLARKDERSLASVVSALVPGGDPRLLPVLVRVLQDGGFEARIAAIKAIAHIPDPRSLAALRKASRHASDTLERVMIARALASFGDSSRGADIIGRLGDDTPEFVREEALKAVGLLPDPGEDLVERIDALIEGESPAIALASIRALSHIGSGETIERLKGLASTSVTLRAAASRAAGDLGARLALSGDNRFELSTTVVTRAVEARPGLVVRMRSVLWYLAGILLIALHRWSQARTVAARSSALNPSSAKGHFLEAYVRVKEGQDEAALTCYRRGLKVDPLYAIRQFGEANRVLTTYLSQAEALAKRFGRRDEAIELLEETEFIDLRSADPNLKIEVDRRLEALKLERRREKLAAEAK
jgi:tetratricopeptide (TPR) repeat protein